MDKMNYSKNMWEDTEVFYPETEDSTGTWAIQERQALPWHSYFFRSRDRASNQNLGLGLSLEHRQNTQSLSLLSRLRMRRGMLVFALLGGSGIFTFFSKHPGSAEVQNILLSELTIPQKPPSPEQHWQDWKNDLQEETSHLKRNEPLAVFLKRYGLSQKQSSDLVLSIDDDIDLTRMRAEDPIRLFFTTNEKSAFSTASINDNKYLVGFQIGSREKTVNAYLYQGETKKEVIYHELSSRTLNATVDVMRSLYQDGVDKGVPGGILVDMFNRYSFDINFQSDIQRGTRYELVYTMIYNEKGKSVGTGDILYANITLANGKSFPIFQYIDLTGKSEFFNPKGRSVNKALLLMPVNGAYISSNFGYRRDPILGTWRLHRGTDYAVPRGTPIKAGGTGRIITRGWSRVGYGYHIIIRHNNGFDTLYGHMSRFRPGFRIGSRVQQGDIIGYVGSTGKSTGPHVHYEVRRYNKPVSLRSLHLQSSRDLRGMDLYLFQSGLRALQARSQGILPDLDKVQTPPVSMASKEGGLGGI